MGIWLIRSRTKNWITSICCGLNQQNSFSIIEKIVLPGTKIYLDCWCSFPVILNYIHKKVNYIKNLVDLTFDACKNNVEWKKAKAYVGYNRRYIA